MELIIEIIIYIVVAILIGICAAWIYLIKSMIETFTLTPYLDKFENLSKKYLEKNLFLLTGFLMTGWFDFVSYGVGLTKLRFRKFLLALFVSALLSDLPFVATGNGFRELQNQNFNIRKIIDGEVPSLQREYLIIFIVSVILIFGLGIIRNLIERKYLKSTNEARNLDNF